MSTLAQTIRHATRRAEDDEETDRETTGATGNDTDEDASDDEDETQAESQTDEESAEDEKEEQPKATATTPKYGLAAATQTLELCAIAGVSAKMAYGYVKARTPLAEVRSKLAAASAPAAKRLETARPKNEAGAGWDDVVAKVNAAQQIAPKR